MGKLYTGFGDMGYTQTQNNRHILKSDAVIELVGTLDEFTSVLGVAKATTLDKGLFSDIESIQKKLISIMGEISGGEKSVTENCVQIIESMCDRYFDESLTEFTLPGSNPVSAHLNVARTVIRRAERIAVKVMQTGRLSKLTFVYINRLSDLIFAMSQYSAKDEKPRREFTSHTAAPALSLDLAKEIALAIEKRAEQLGKRIVVAITDTGANLLLLHSMNDAYIASCQVAQDKAYTAVALKMPTHTALAETRGGNLDGLSATGTNKLSLLGGGYPLTINGTIVGGLGVSGGTAEEDTNFAHFGVLYLERRSEYNG